MRTLFEPSKLLDRGGRPTVRELLSGLQFNPADGTIRLNGDRLVMQRAAVGGTLRRELLCTLGEREARVFLIRLGFLSGQADARLVRTRWPRLDIGDAFTAGTRLHMFSGVVRVETIYNDFDFRKGRFAAEFLWHDSAEAEECRGQRPAAEPVCWTQLGYASGYATEFFNRLIIYKETECAAQGHRCCKVVGKPAGAWGDADPEVVLFRERIVPAEPAQRPERAVAPVAGTGLSDLDRLLLAPVKERLDLFAPMALPVLVTGEPGTGRARGARYLHRTSPASVMELKHVLGVEVDGELCRSIARRTGPRRRGSAVGMVLIDAIETVAAELQPHLAHAIEEGIAAGGPRVVAIENEAAAAGEIVPALRTVLSPLRVRLPSFAERGSQCVAIATALIASLAARMNIEIPILDGKARNVIEETVWSGNAPQMRAVLTAALVAHRGGVLSGRQIKVQLQQRSEDPGPFKQDEQVFGRLVADLVTGDALTLPKLERSIYRAAVEAANGNLSAAARRLGLTRAQLAYRIKAQEPADGGVSKETGAVPSGSADAAASEGFT